MSQSTMREIIPTEANKNNLDTTVALSINLDRTHGGQFPTVSLVMEADVEAKSEEC